MIKTIQRSIDERMSELLSRGITPTVCYLRDCDKHRLIEEFAAMSEEEESIIDLSRI